LPHGSFERIEATHRALAAARTAGDTRLLIKAFAAYGEQLSPIRRLDEAKTAFEESLALARAEDSPWDAARALAGLTTIAVDREQIEEARGIAARALALFNEVGATDGVAYVSLTLGEAELVAGNLSEAIVMCRRARDAHGKLGNNRSSACAADLLAALYVLAGDPEAARIAASDALALLENDRHPMFFTEAIEHLGQVAALAGDASRGALLHGYAGSALAKLAHARNRASQACCDGTAERLIEALGAAEFTRLSAAGAALTEDEALAEAFAISTAGAASPASADALAPPAPGKFVPSVDNEEHADESHRRRTIDR
jgi:tetratricopeptide (TPR) repeat protein